MSTYTVSYSAFKQIATNTSNSGANIFYYIQSVGYTVSCASQLDIYLSQISASADITDFNNNFKNTATSVSNEGDLFGLAVKTYTTTPISGTIAAPTLTKGTQGSTGWSVQNLKDAGRTNIMWTIDNQSTTSASEILLTVTESRDGAATTTFTSKTITSGKRLRITSFFGAIDAGGTTPAISRCTFKIRVNTAGAVTTSSPLQSILKLPHLPAVAKNSVNNFVNYFDGIEFAGDGTKQIGITLLCPDWVTTTNIPTISLTILGFEY